MLEYDGLGTFGLLFQTLENLIKCSIIMERMVLENACYYKGKENK
jgi:hypothetical protein